MVKWMRNVMNKHKKPEHLMIGSFGENKAKCFLKTLGYRFLIANYQTERGEIDLVFRSKSEALLLFVEVKTRSFIDMTLKPSNLVSLRQRKRINSAALDYLKELGNPKVRIQFDIIVVEYSGRSQFSIHHIPRAFGLMGGRDYRT